MTLAAPCSKLVEDIREFCGVVASLEGPNIALPRRLSQHHLSHKNNKNICLLY